jgi:hypothetical protein
VVSTQSTTRYKRAIFFFFFFFCTKQNLLISFPYSKFPTLLVQTVMQCASRQLYNRLGGKSNTLYKHTKLLIFTTRPGQSSYTNGAKGDGMTMTNNKLRLHNIATAPWRGLATGPKESSTFPLKNPLKTTPPALSLFHVLSCQQDACGDVRSSY